MPQSTGEHFFPRGDADFTAWGDRFNDYVQANFAALGLSAAEATGLNSAWFRFRIGYAAQVQARAAAAAAYQEKARSRRAFEALLRPAVRRIQTFAATTDAQRGQLGITIPDRTRTPIGPPTTRPLVKVDFSRRLSHRIAFADEGTPTRRTKPKGVIGAELWVKLTALGAAPPGGPADLSFLMLSTRSPAVAEYGGADAGKTAHYMIR
ncbi:MAG: hypothetical protein HZA51_14780 [Planctomycetes bacterium]|nr:hypothetical protein [Planctomycetota bacterium]